MLRDTSGTNPSIYSFSSTQCKCETGNADYINGRYPGCSCGLTAYNGTECVRCVNGIYPIYAISGEGGGANVMPQGSSLSCGSTRADKMVGTCFGNDCIASTPAGKCSNGSIPIFGPEPYTLKRRVGADVYVVASIGRNDAS